MRQSSSPRILAAVLFTDMVDSTSIAEEMGDRRWKTLTKRHHGIVRRELKRFGGREIDTAGDGFFATFREPAAAIACASAASEAVRELGVEIRAGVHFGECEQIGKNLSGITVVVGARIMALGGAGDVLVSGTVAELTRGAGYGMSDRGTHRLKGVGGEWKVFASREQLRQWGYTKVKRVPSIQIDYERCATLAGVEAAMCWARIDQLITGELVVAVPISSADVIRLRSGDISGFAIDQAFGEPALDRISVDG